MLSWRVRPKINLRYIQAEGVESPMHEPCSCLLNVDESDLMEDDTSSLLLISE